MSPLNGFWSMLLIRDCFFFLVFFSSSHYSLAFACKKNVFFLHLRVEGLCRYSCWIYYRGNGPLQKLYCCFIFERLLQLKGYITEIMLVKFKLASSMKMNYDRTVDFSAQIVCFETNEMCQKCVAKNIQKELNKFQQFFSITSQLIICKISTQCVLCV